MNLESTLVSKRDGRLVYNEQKKQSFIFKHNLRKDYKDGIYLRIQLDKSKKFIPEDQELIDDFEIIMALASCTSNLSYSFLSIDSCLLCFSFSDLS